MPIEHAGGASIRCLLSALNIIVWCRQGGTPGVTLEGRVTRWLYACSAGHANGRACAGCTAKKNKQAHRGTRQGYMGDTGEGKEDIDAECTHHGVQLLLV